MKRAGPNADAPAGPRTTDIARWRDVANLDPAWGARVNLAADFIPAGAAVLDVGCGAMLLDVFQRGYPEDTRRAVDRAAVVRYKAHVRRQMRALGDKIDALLYT